MESLTDDQRALFADGGQLDDYEVLKPIGKGKFSVVYKAIRRHDNQAVALKKIAIFDMMNLKAREKTLKEVRLVQSVRHPNIIQYLDAFVENNELCIAFEWAEAGDLKRQIRKANEKGVRFDERTIWRYFAQLCAALLYLHDARIMHRDLKPANIFLTLKGVVKVGDLGLGRYLSENTMEARSKVGTPLYMSPEVLRGESYDWKSDVWSMGCILYELAMLRSPFKSEGLNLVGLFHKINKGDYQDIPDVYSDHLRELVRRMISLTPSDRPTVQEVWGACQSRPTSAILQERTRRHQASLGNNGSRSSNTARARKAKTKNGPENDNSQPSSSDKQQGTPSNSRPPSAQGDIDNGDDEELVRRRHAEARMELLFESLKILRYEKILKKHILPTHFITDTRILPGVTPQSRFKDMHVLSTWLLSLLGGEVDNNNNDDDTPLVATQKLLLAAEKVGVSGVAQLSAPALTSGFGVEVCDLLGALAAAAVSKGDFCTTPPVYTTEPVEIMEACDELDVTDDGEQESSSNHGCGGSTASLAYDDDDVFSHWIVVKEYDDSKDDDRENAIIHSNIDPVAWDQERRRMLPKLKTALQDKQWRRPCEASWRMRLDQLRIQGGMIVDDQAITCQEVTQIQAIRHKQANQLEGYEKQLNDRFLRAHRLYDESTTRLAKARDEISIIQESVNKATSEVATLQTTRAAQLNALKVADERLTDNSMLLELKRQISRIGDENQDMSLQLQVLHDYWTRKQQHQHRLEQDSECSHKGFV